MRRRTALEDVDDALHLLQHDGLQLVEAPAEAVVAHVPQREAPLLRPVVAVREEDACARGRPWV